MDRQEIRMLLSSVPPHWRVKLPSADDQAVRMDAGGFSATIQAEHSSGRYYFHIRAEDREQPTIYGFGSSLRQAFRAAAELMRNLCPASQPERKTWPRAA